MSDDKAFKNLIDTGTVAALGERLERVVPGFDRAAFEATASEGLEALELKARVAWIAAAMDPWLEADVPRALGWLLAAMGPPQRGSEDVTAGIAHWPILHWVETHGAEHPEHTLPALMSMTRRFSAEFAVRPLLERDLEGTIAVLEGWLDHPDVHVRRWLSEGTRPRLPWGGNIKALQRDPSPTLPILEALYRDPEEYVRRSVANHLNDISKDHPDLAVDIAKRWWNPDHRETTRLVKHALRGLLKAGHPGALAVLGYGPPEGLDLTLRLEPAPVVIGSKLAIHLELHNPTVRPLRLMLKYAVHYQRKSPGLSRKVFTWTERQLAPGQRLALTKNQAMKHVSIRRLYPGEHRVEILVNGQTLANASFELVPGS
jgi:3-methyladenine DNA glycosylase AlkC